GEVAVVAIGPEMAPAPPIDQLRGDPHPVADLADTTLEDVCHSKLPRHFADVHGLALEGESAVSGDHFEGGDLGQVGRNVLADPVAEIFLLGVAAHVLEWQHAD